MMYSRIEMGEFKNKVEYPTKPIRPVLLSKTAGELSMEELASVSKVKQQFDDALFNYRQDLANYHKGESAATDLFRSELLKDNGMDPNDEFANVLYNKAWSDGHSSGYSDVLSCFVDLLPIWEHVQKNYVKREPKLRGDAVTNAARHK